MKNLFDTEFDRTLAFIRVVAGGVMLAQIRKLDTILAAVRRNAQRVYEGVRGLPGIQFRHLPDPAGEIGTVVFIRFDSKAKRDKFMAYFPTAIEWADVTVSRHLSNHYGASRKRAICSCFSSAGVSSTPFLGFHFRWSRWDAARRFRYRAAWKCGANGDADDPVHSAKGRTIFPPLTISGFGFSH